MPRLRLEALPSYPFSIELSVRVTDLNYGGHLGNDRLLALLHEARVSFLAEHGLSELDCAGVSLIMGDAALVYQGEALAGDRLVFELSAGEPGRAGFRFFYRVTRCPDRAPVAMAETGMVCYDYTASRICPLPERIREICAPGP